MTKTLYVNLYSTGFIDKYYDTRDQAEYCAFLMEMCASVKRVALLVVRMK